jgi:hypothetical protein
MTRRLALLVALAAALFAGGTAQAYHAESGFGGYNLGIAGTRCPQEGLNGTDAATGQAMLCIRVNGELRWVIITTFGDPSVNFCSCNCGLYYGWICARPTPRTLPVVRLERQSAPRGALSG